MNDHEQVVDEDGEIDHEAVQRRIESLVERAEQDATAFQPPRHPPDREQAMTYLRSGAGQVIALYAFLRTGGRLYPFSETDIDRLEEAMNTWFDLYAAALGSEIESDVSIRAAAEVFVDTEDIAAVAGTVTGVTAQ